MSIINDALKKTQQNFERQKKIFTSPPNASQPNAPQPVSGKFFDIAGAVIIASFMASVLVLGGIFLFGPKEKRIVLPATTGDPQLSTPTATSSSIAQEPPLAPPPKKAPETKANTSDLTLNGIVQMGEGYVALINNRILKEGDKINDKKILGIYSDHVKVFDNGEVVILKRERF